MNRAAALAFLTLLLSTRPAAAAPSVVALVGPERPEAQVAEALVRMKAELGAAGFDVREVSARPGEAPRAALERAAADLGAALAVAIDRGTSAAAAEVWVADRVTNKTLVRAVPASGDAQVLALRTIELVRASLLELERPSPPVAKPPPDVVRFAAPPPAPRRGPWESFQVQLSGEVLVHASALPPSFLPSLALSYGFPVGAFVRLVGAAPSLSPELAIPGGSVSLSLQRASLGVGFGGWLAKPWIAAEVELSGGFLHAEAAARVSPPALGRTTDGWAFLGGLVGGLSLTIADGWAIPLSVGLLVGAPETFVAYEGENLGTIGRPSVSFGLGVRRRVP